VCTHLGFTLQQKAYKFVHHPTQQFFTLQDVIFDEGGTAIERVIIEHNHIVETQTLHQIQPAQNIIQQVQQHPQQQTLPSPNILSRPKRITCIPQWFTNPSPATGSSWPTSELEETKRATVTHANVSPDRHTYAEAMAHPNATKWEIACKDEECTFERMGVYEIVPCPKDQKVVGSKWVFCIKRGPDSQILKYKAQVVTQGFSQVEGVDYDQTFAPVAKFASLHTLLTIAAERDLEVHQMDVKSAYLNGELQEDIFMNAPAGFNVLEGMVLKLVKAVYGTKQGGRVWYEEIRNTLSTMGYQCTDADHTVFIHQSDSPPSFIVLYIDDITMVAECLETITWDKEALSQKYQMSDLSELTWILGMHVTRERVDGTITLSQVKYIGEILKRFRHSNSCPIATPSLANEHLKKLLMPEINAKAYQSAIRALMYPMLGSRPDLAYTMAALGHHAATPGNEHNHALE